MDSHRPWRKVTVAQRRTAADFAERMRDLVNVDFPDADKIRVVRDNLSTHTPGPLSTRRSPRPRPIASSAGWSSTSRRSTPAGRSEEHTSELQSLMRISYAVFCLKKKQKN